MPNAKVRSIFIMTTNEGYSYDINYSNGERYSSYGSDNKGLTIGQILNKINTEIRYKDNVKE